MEKPVRQYGVKEPASFTCVKWSSHAPNLLALGTAANFGIVGKGGVQVKSLDGSKLTTVAVAEEVVIFTLFRKLSLMSRGSNSMISSCSWGREMEKSHFGKLDSPKLGRFPGNLKLFQSSAHIKILYSSLAV
jgi:hypothetical protein